MRRTTLGPLDSSSSSSQPHHQSALQQPRQIPRPSMGRQSLGYGLNSMASQQQPMHQQSQNGRPSLGPALRKSNLQNLPGDLNNLNLNDSRASIGDRHSNIMSRRSSAYGAGRQSSIGTQQQQQTLLKDPRNIRDKAWMNGAIRSLVKFLMEAGYDRSISGRVMTAPSIKDVQLIFMFLYGKIDPGYQWKKKFEDDLIPLLKSMKYPFADSITKSVLMAVGSLHSWPTLLAVLVWMVELIMICETMDYEMEQDSSNSDPDRLFTAFLVRSYDEYMLGKSDYEALEAEMHGNFREKEEVTKADVKRLEAENAALEEQLRSMKTELSPLSKQQKRQSEILDDIEKVKKWCESLRQKKEQLLDQIGSLKQELDQANTELIQTSEEKEKLQAIVDSQEISPAEADRMNAERDQLCKNIESFNLKQEELTKTIWALEIECQKRMDQVEKLVQDYNAKAYRLELIPSNAKNASGMDFEVVLNSNFIKAEQMISINLRGTVKTYLNEFRTHLKSEIIKVEDAHVSQKEAFDRIAESLAEKQEEVAQCEGRLAHINQQISTDKELSIVEFDAITNEFESLDREIRRVKVERSREVFDCQKEIRELEIEYESVSRRYAETRDKWLKQANRIFHEIVEFKRQLVNPLDEFKTSIERDYQFLVENDKSMAEGLLPSASPQNADLITDMSFCDKDILIEMDQ